MARVYKKYTVWIVFEGRRVSPKMATVLGFIEEMDKISVLPSQIEKLPAGMVGSFLADIAMGHRFGVNGLGKEKLQPHAVGFHDHHSFIRWAWQLERFCRKWPDGRVVVSISSERVVPDVGWLK